MWALSWLCLSRCWLHIHICGCSYLCVFLSHFVSWESLSLNVELVDLTLSQIPDMDHHVWVFFPCMSEIQTWVHFLWFTNWVPSRKAGMGKEVERMAHSLDGFIVCSCMFFCKVYVYEGMFTHKCASQYGAKPLVPFLGHHHPSLLLRLSLTSFRLAK